MTRPCSPGRASGPAPSCGATVLELRPHVPRRHLLLGLPALGLAGLANPSAGQVAFGHEDIFFDFWGIRAVLVGVRIYLWQRERWRTTSGDGSPQYVPEVEPGGLLPSGFSKEAQLRAEDLAAELLVRHDARWYGARGTSERRSPGTPVPLLRMSDPMLMKDPKLTVDERRGVLLIDLQLFVRDATEEARVPVPPGQRLVAITDLRRHRLFGAEPGRDVTWAPGLVVESIPTDEVKERVLARLDAVLNAALSRVFPPRQ